MYYIQSRYYDAKVDRFVNSDAADMPITYTQLEENKFTYCVNDPINNTDLSGNIAAFLLKKVGSVIINAVIGLLAQVLGDVLMSAIKKNWHFSSVGTYISAVAKGAWDGLWGGGLAREICKSMLANILSQLIDMIGKKKQFDLISLLTSVFDGILSYVVSKVVKVPKYIRDIKKKAMEKGIKGTKKLLKFLNKEIWKKLSFQLSLNGIFNFVTQLIGEVISYMVACAKEMFEELKKDIGGMTLCIT